MSDFKLEAELREKTGKAETRRLRRTGALPAIIYGGDKQDLPIALNALEIGKLLNNEHFHTSMIDIKVKGKRSNDSVILKSVQYDPLRDEAAHLDFLRVSSSDVITLEIPVHAINEGKCPGVKEGGLVEVVRHVLEVSCRADSIPDAINIDCSGLNIGDTVHIEDVKLPEGVKVPHGVDFTVLTVSAPTVHVEAAEEEASEGEEA